MQRISVRCTKYFFIMAIKRNNKKLPPLNNGNSGKLPYNPFDGSPNYHGQDLDNLSDYLPKSDLDDPFSGKLDGGINLPDPSGGSSLPNPDIGNIVLPDNGLFPTKSKWSDLLEGADLGGFADILAQFGVISPKDMDKAAIDDWNKELLQRILDYATQVENRNYNRSLQLEQREYDSYGAQLSRLMALGISRDAAIQMLNGSGGGSGSGVPYSDAMQEGIGGIAPSESKFNRIQSGVAIANSFFNGVGALASLVNLGFSIPQALSQIGIQKTAAFMSDQQLKAFDSASTAFGIINSSGIPATENVFGSIDATAKTIQNLASTGNAAASAFVNNGGLDQLRQTAPFSAPLLNQLYKNERDSSDYSASFGATMRKMFAETELTQANKDLLGVQARQLEQEISTLRAQEEYTYMLSAAEQWHAELLREQGKQVSLANDLEEQWRTPDSMQMYSDRVMQSLYKDVATLTQLNNSKIWEKEVKSMLSDYDKMIAVNELNILYSQGTLDVLDNGESKFNNLLYLCNAAKDCGLFDYVDAHVNAHTGRNVGPVQIGVPGAEDPLYLLRGVDYKIRHRN